VFPSQDEIQVYTNALQAELARYGVFDRTELVDAEAGTVRAFGADRHIDIPIDKASFSRAKLHRTLPTLVKRTAHTAAIDWVRNAPITDYPAAVLSGVRPV
jgi:hypothetical protein